MTGLNFECTQPDQRVWFDWKPACHTSTLMKWEMANFSYDSTGLRKNPLDRSTPSGVTVLFLGDSDVHGAGVSDHQALPVRFDFHYNRQFPERRIRVYNAGRDASGAIANSIRLERHLKELRPKYLIYYHAWIEKVFFETVLYRSGLVNFSEGAPISLKRPKDNDLHWDYWRLRTLWEGFFLRRSPDFFAEATRLGLSRIAELCSKYGVKLIVPFPEDGLYANVLVRHSAHSHFLPKWLFDLLNPRQLRPVGEIFERLDPRWARYPKFSYLDIFLEAERSNSHPDGVHLPAKSVDEIAKRLVQAIGPL